MSLRGARTKALVVGIAGLMAGGLLAGCSGKGATTASATPTASQVPSETPAEPAPAPTETPDWMVNDAEGNPVFAPAGETLPETDVEGAEQAAESFLRSYFTGLEEQSSQYMREHSSEGCVYCAERVRDIDDISNKGYVVEVRGEPVFSNVEAIGPQPEQPAHIVVLDLSFPAVVVKDLSGSSVEESPADNDSFILAIENRPEGWKVQEGEVPDSERLASVRDFIDYLEE